MPRRRAINRITGAAIELMDDGQWAPVEGGATEEEKAMVMQRAMGDPQATQREAAGKVGKGLAAAALPMALGMAGPLAAPAHPIIAGAVGGMAGTTLNQVLGIEEPSVESVASSGLFGLALPGAVKGAGKALSKLPGGKIIEKGPMIKRAEGLTSEVRARQPAGIDPLFKTAREQGSEVMMGVGAFPSTAQTLEALEKQSKLGFKSGLGVMKGRAAEVTQMISRPEGASAEEVMTKVTQLGATIRSLERKGGMGLGAAKTLWGSMLDDLDNLPTTSQASESFKAARKAAQKEFALETMDEVIFGPAVRTRVPKIKGPAQVWDIDGDKVISKLEQLTNPKAPGYDRNFTRGLEGELPEIKKFFDRMGDIGHLKVEMEGGGLVIRSALGAAGAGAVGGLMGGVPGAALAGTIGAVAGAKAPDVISRLIMHPTGRRLLESTLKFTGNRITLGTANMLAQMARVESE